MMIFDTLPNKVKLPPILKHQATHRINCNWLLHGSNSSKIVNMYKKGPNIFVPSTQNPVIVASCKMLRLPETLERPTLYQVHFGRPVVLKPLTHTNMAINIIITDQSHRFSVSEALRLFSIASVVMINIAAPSGTKPTKNNKCVWVIIKVYRYIKGNTKIVTIVYVIKQLNGYSENFVSANKVL